MHTSRLKPVGQTVYVNALVSYITMAIRDETLTEQSGVLRMVTSLHLAHDSLQSLSVLTLKDQVQHA